MIPPPMSAQPFHLPPGVSWIDNDDSLAEAIPRWQAAPELAIDTEADSYYCYRVKVCLLQVSTRDHDWLVDPLQGLDLRALRPVCADPAVRKVIHAASNDVALLRHAAALEFVNVFDTMIAAQVLGLRRPGLGALLQERFGVVQEKSLQTSDWRRRPLSREQLEYAAADTRFLLPLHDQLRADLIAKGRLEEAEEDFGRVARAEHTERVLDPDAWKRAPGAFELDPTRVSVLRELYAARDAISAERDTAPHRVLRDEALVAIARELPRNRDELGRMRRSAGPAAMRDADVLLEAVRRGLAAPPWRPERRKRGDHEEAPMGDRERRVFEALREWRRERARARDVEESRVATTGLLRALAREPALTKERIGAVAGMTPFRVREYGDEIVAVAAQAAEAPRK